MSDFIFLGSKINADSDCSLKIKRRLLLGRIAMSNLDSSFKSRDITLQTKVRIVKAMTFQVVTYGCESWIMKKAEHRRIDALKLWSWRRKWQRIPVFLVGKFHGWRSLVGYSSRGHKELDTTERLRFLSFSTLPTKVPLVKIMVFPVVMYGCETWTIKKAKHQRIDAFELWCCRRLLRVPWTARKSN